MTCEEVLQNRRTWERSPEMHEAQTKTKLVSIISLSPGLWVCPVHLGETASERLLLWKQQVLVA